MLTTFLTTVNAVVPIILLILLGYLLKRFKFLNKDFIKLGNKFVFKVCLPCMLFINIYDSMKSFADVNWTVVIYAVLVIVLIFGLGLLTAILTTKDNKRRGVILQCTFRSNFAIIGLTLVERLGGDTAIAGIVSAFSIPVFNILAVIALSIFTNKGEEEAENKEEQGEAVNADGTASTMIEASNSASVVKKPAKKNSAVGILLNIVKNPLIIGVVIGLVFVGIREIEVAICGVPAESLPFRFDTQLKFLYTAVKDLKAIASPLALIVLGGQFEFSAVKGMTKEIIVATAWRVILAPLLGIGIAILLSTFTPIKFGAEVYPTMIALFGTPVAVSSAIMAGEMKNDEQLATQLVVWTSIVSIVTIFVIVFVLMSFGLLTAV
ncbi:MAG: AEC family transporter [Candidatus Coproplasma sp.]